jgi:beta-galactosidase
VNLLTQYFRPPFPLQPRWRDDLAQIAATGLDAIEVWATWAWIESHPGHYDFTDFDDLFAEAERAGLDVVITSVAELNPYWIHREIPDSHMVDHRGRRVASSTLAYTHHGLCPGGCTDHPEVRARIGAFLEQLGAHFRDRPNLRSWDCWNELRWAVQSDGHVCFCRHTLDAFREWLRGKHGDLEGLNGNWHRRYASWEDVFPGTQPARNWTETIEFEQFLAWRGAENTSFRVACLKRGDGSRPVIAHSVVLSSFMAKGEDRWEQPLSRGNDWEIATRVDGFGASHFPGHFHTSNAEAGARHESARSAAAGKPYWVCELQGGAAGLGFVAMPGVPASRQERWIWNAFARGAETIAFWCWRDEVFGRESGGYGIVGNDGHAKARLEALRRTTSALRNHSDVLDGYVPNANRVGVVFDGVNHQLEWAFSGPDSTQSANSVFGYILSLERLQIPYDVLEASHLPDLGKYSVLFLPWPMIVRPAAAEALATWVEAGGTLLVESELDAFDELGLYRYPDERPFAAALGLQADGRRPLGETRQIEFALDATTGHLVPGTWLDPLVSEGETLAATPAGTVLLERAMGSGTIFAVGTHAGMAYRLDPYPDFERLVHAIVGRAGALPEIACSVPDGERIQWRSGTSGEHRIVFVLNGGAPTALTLTGTERVFGETYHGTELLSGDPVKLDHRDPPTLSLSLREDDVKILVL